ncbi:MAG: DUF2149 domain-containing protein [Desulfobacteraceae bacterium]|nr:DUF2149 domain-containing protein [Desulfobacteraceae bacterium]
MRFLQQRRAFQTSAHTTGRAAGPEDPLSGLANLFDIGLVFIVGLILALFSTLHMEELLDKDAEITIMKKNTRGEMEIITKKGKNVTIKRVTQTEAQGRGERLGTAYRLENGSMVYVPD